MATTVAKRPIITIKNAVTTPPVVKPDPGVWEVFMPCVLMNVDGTESGRYVQLTYYVQAKTPEEAVEITTSWLPKKYELDDAATASPFKPMSMAETARRRRERIHNIVGA